MCPISIASCYNSLLLAQKRIQSQTVWLSKWRRKKAIICWECNSWACKSNSRLSAVARCFNTDGSTLTRTGEYHQVTGDHCPAFACIMVGVISLLILLWEKRAALPFLLYHLQLFLEWSLAASGLFPYEGGHEWLWAQRNACLAVGCWAHIPAPLPPFKAWASSPALTWHALAFKTPFSTFQCGNGHPVKPGGRRERPPATSSRRRTSELSLSPLQV